MVAAGGHAGMNRNMLAVDDGNDRFAFVHRRHLRAGAVVAVQRNFVPCKQNSGGHIPARVGVAALDVLVTAHGRGTDVVFLANFLYSVAAHTAYGAAHGAFHGLFGAAGYARQHLLGPVQRTACKVDVDSAVGRGRNAHSSTSSNSTRSIPISQMDDAT